MVTYVSSIDVLYVSISSTISINISIWPFLSSFLPSYLSIFSLVTLFVGSYLLLSVLQLFSEQELWWHPATMFPLLYWITYALLSVCSSFQGHCFNTYIILSASSLRWETCISYFSNHSATSFFLFTFFNFLLVISAVTSVFILCLSCSLDTILVIWDIVTISPSPLIEIILACLCGLVGIFSPLHAIVPYSLQIRDGL